MLKRIIALLLAALLAGGIAVCEEADFGFDFADEGYTGEWTPIEALGMEFCLPDGWTPVTPGEGAAFAAAKDDGTAGLSVRLEEEGVEDVLAWAERRLDSYRVDESSFYEVLVVEDAGAVTLRFICNEGQLVAFDFTRESEAALTTDFALEIAGSTYESWIDEGFPMDDEDADFDFFAAFGEEVG